MNNRRAFLRQMVPAGAAGYISLRTDWLERIVSATTAVAGRDVEPSDLTVPLRTWKPTLGEYADAAGRVTRFRHYCDTAKHIRADRGEDTTTP